MSSGCSCGEVDASRQGDASYRRALRTVFSLNAGMAIAGAAIALWTGSVSVFSDVLDFVGDAAATGIGLLLIASPQRTRSRAALMQGLALGALGVLALGSSCWRAAGGLPPEAAGMGIYGACGLAANAAAALAMMRHRGGDASARAVWLYSRNDALGNLAVIVASIGVALSGSRWPDIAAGAAIAVLFLHSARAIVVHALSEIAAEPSSRR